jgi:hypothetical protein
MWEAWQEFTEGHSEILGVIDSTDPCRHDYPHREGIKYELVQENSFAHKLRGATWRNPQYEAVASWNDDHVVRTPWETIQLAALDEMGGGIVYGDDLYQRERLPTAPTISMTIIKALGWICPPTLRHMYIDNFWGDLGRHLGRIRYQPEVIIEHVHYQVNKAEEDETYKRSNEPEAFAADMREYQRYLKHDFQADLEKVRVALHAAGPN